jgi:PAS domain S-box-containing protein
MPAEPPTATEAVTAPSRHQIPREEVFRLLIEAVEDYAIFLIAPDGQVLTWNLGAQRAKGYRADEIIGKNFSAFYTPEERAAGRPARMLGLAAEHGRVEDEGWRVRKDGTRFWADVVLTALRDRTGMLYAFAKITRDLTERKAAEKQQQTLAIEQRARAAAEEALVARDRFLSVASHELRTPVASLQLAAESVARARDLGRLDEARLGAGLARILNSTSRLSMLVNELLDVSRLTDDTALPIRSPINVVTLIGEVIARFADAEAEERIRLDAPEVVTIDADASRLDQVFSNLIDNALKYSAATDPVDVRVVDEPGSVIVTIADRGIGLDAASEAILFEAFSRGANASHVSGLGLGLYISSQIVERHGGRLEAEPGAGGRGSTFRVWLPKEDAA